MKFRIYTKWHCLRLKAAMVWMRKEEGGNSVLLNCPNLITKQPSSINKIRSFKNLVSARV